MAVSMERLPEELLLEVLSHLDLTSLVGMERVSSRFARLAKDASIYRRIGHAGVDFARRRGGGIGWALVFRSDLALFRPIVLDRDAGDEKHLSPNEARDAAAKCLSILHHLLERGAELRSLSLQSVSVCRLVAAPLASLLASHSARLRGLAVALDVPRDEELLLELAKAQPELEHLSLRRGGWQPLDSWLEPPGGLGRAFPSLRHVDVLGTRWLRCVAAFEGLLRRLAPQLHSVYLASANVTEYDQLLGIIPGQRLRPRCVGTYEKRGAASVLLRHVGLASDGFRETPAGPETSGPGRLRMDWDGDGWRDLWDQATVTLPIDSTSFDQVKEVLREVYRFRRRKKAGFET